MSNPPVIVLADKTVKVTNQLGPVRALVGGQLPQSAPIGSTEAEIFGRLQALEEFTAAPHLHELAALSGMDQMLDLASTGEVSMNPLGAFGKLLASSPSQAYALGLLGQLPLRNVVTSCYIPTTFSAFSQSFTRKMHIAKDDITSLWTLQPTWYAPATGPEQLLGHVLPQSQWIELDGVFTRVSFRGLVKPYLVDGVTTISDEISINIPRGAIFWEWVRSYDICPATAQGGSISYTVVAHAAGEGSSNQTSGLPDDPGEIPGGKERLYGTAVAILARTAINSMALIGNSRLFGANDNPDLFANDGEWVKGLSPNGLTAYSNFGVSGDTPSAYYSRPRSRALLEFFNIVGHEAGINNWAVNGGTVEGLVADYLRGEGRFRGKKLFRGTLLPWGTADIDSVNANHWIRSDVHGVSHIEVANGGTTADDSGTWKPGYTDGDLLHANPTGVAGILASGVIDPTVPLTAPIIDIEYVPEVTDRIPVFIGGYLVSGAMSAYGILPGTQPWRFEITVNWSVAGGATATIFGINTIFALQLNTSGQLLANAQALTIAPGGSTALTPNVDHKVQLFCDSTGLYINIDGVLATSHGVGLLGKFQTPFANFAIGGMGQVDKTNPTLNAGWTLKLTNFSSWLYGVYRTAPLTPYTGTETGLVSYVPLKTDTSVIMGPELINPVQEHTDPTTSPVPIFAIEGPLAVIEGNTAAYAVKRYGFTGQACSCTAEVINITSAASDFGGSFPSTLISFAGSEFTKPFNVPITDSVLYRNPRDYYAKLSAPSDSGIIDALQVKTRITDNQAPPAGNAHYTLVPPDPTTESSSGNRNSIWTILRTVNTSATETISWMTSEGPSPSLNALDFTTGVFPTGTVTFNPGDAFVHIIVSIHSDVIVESDENYRLTIFNATAGGVFITDTGVAVIENDD